MNFNDLKNKCINILPSNIIANNIPERLQDNTLLCTKNNTALFYIICIIIRIILGILIFENKISNNIIYILSSIIIIIFLYKYSYNIYKSKKNWKNYPKTIILYSLVIIFTYLNTNNNNNIAGILIMFDLLLGIDNKHITSNMLE